MVDTADIHRAPLLKVIATLEAKNLELKENGVRCSCCGVYSAEPGLHDCPEILLIVAEDERVLKLRAEVERLKVEVMRDASQDYVRYSKVARVFHRIVTAMGDPETSFRDLGCMLDQPDAYEIVESYVDALLRDFESKASPNCSEPAREYSFTCPECSGHHWGVSNTAVNRTNWQVNCHGQYGPCKWRGSYDEHIATPAEEKPQ